MFFEPKGVDGQRRVGAIIGAAQHAFTRGIVEIPLLLTVGRAAPVQQVIQRIVGRTLGRATPLLAGHVAPGVVAAGVVDGAFTGTGGARRDLRQVAQLVRVAAVAVQVLLLGAGAVLRSLPELAQVGVGVAGGVGSAQRG